MFPGGEYSPLAVFIQDFSCPEASDRQTVMSDIDPDCQREAINILVRHVSRNIQVLNLYENA